MFADLLPVLVLAGTALLMPMVILRATKRRERYCGDKLRHCFWCGEQCTYYQLEDEPVRR